MKLTQEQRDFISAVQITEDNIALCALAGSGKTFSLVKACEALPGNKKIIALAFNASIAKELGDRLPLNATAKTMNSLGHGVVQKLVGDKKLKVNRTKVGKIVRNLCYENNKLWDHWTDLCRIIDIARIEGLVPADICNKYGITPLLEDTDNNWDGLIYDNGLELDKVHTSVFREVLGESIRLMYEGEIDFQDQVYVGALWGVPAPKYDVILVDEAQDLSPIQHKMIDRIMREDSRIIIAGDKNQAIYAWRGALTNSLESMIERYNCKEMPLTTSFRCSREVVKEARKTVPDINHAPDANNGTVRKLQDWSADDVKANSSILCRNVAPLVRLTYALIADGRPAIMKGRDIGRGLQNLVKKMVRPKPVLDIPSFLRELHKWSEAEIAIARAKGNPWKEESTNDKMGSIEAVLKNAFCQNTDDLIEAIDKLFSVNSFGRVELSTIHRAKGFEWKDVYFLDPWRVPSKYAKKAIKDKAPGAKEIMKQEYNLRYVAITRAKETLTYINSDGFRQKEEVAA